MSDLKMHLGRPAAWVEVTGEDSLTFLQGQGTNDLSSPATRPATYTLWLDRKGKVVADSFVLQEAEDRFYLYSTFTPAETLIARLEPYIIADDVALRDLTGEAAFATLWGKGLDDALLHAGFERPDQGEFLHANRAFLFHGRRSRAPNIEMVVIGDDNETTMAKLSAAVKNDGGDLVGASVVERERIEACIPAIPRDIGESDLPQEGGLDRDAVSFTKGCYLGQEVMARIRSMGQVRRTLVQLSLDVEETEVPATLFANGREAGSLRSVAGPAPALGLALIRIDCLKETRDFSLSPDGPASARVSIVMSD